MLLDAPKNGYGMQLLPAFGVKESGDLTSLKEKEIYAKVQICYRGKLSIFNYTKRLGVPSIQSRHTTNVPPPPYQQPSQSPILQLPQNSIIFHGHLS
jgi:hypothetical protein